MEHFPNLFCINCQAFLNPRNSACSIQCDRVEDTRISKAGDHLWQAKVPGSIHSVLVVADLVIFGYGERHGKGGVSAFNREDGTLKWSFATMHPVEGGPVHFDKYLFFATTGFIHSGAELYCLDLAGKQVWNRQLAAGAWSSPVVDEARVHIGLDNGQITSYDSHTGEPISQRAVNMPAGKIWLSKVDDKTLVAFSKSGQIMSLSTIGLQSRWLNRVDTGCEITSPACLARDRLYFGGLGGKVFSVDLRDGTIRQLAGDLKGVIAAPVLAPSGLWVGAQDHSLRIFNLENGQPGRQIADFEHGISSKPFAGGNLVAVSVNQFGVVLFDAHSCEQIWAYKVDHGASLLSEPVMAGEAIYVGTNLGDVFALPWHLGEYERAAQHLKSRGQLYEAGLYYALAARQASRPAISEQHYAQAEACWNENGTPEWAARMWEGMREEVKAGDAYSRAAAIQRGKNPALAADYYYAASRLYWRVGGLAEKVEQAAVQALKLGGSPILRLEKWNIPDMVQGQESVITIRVSNTGYGPARDLFFNLGASLAKPVKHNIDIPLAPDSYFYISMGIIQTKARDELQIEVEYRGNDVREHPFIAKLSLQIDAKEPKRKITIRDTVLVNFDIILQDKNTDIDIDGSVIIGPHPNPTVQATPVEFTWPADLPDALRPVEQILIRVNEVQDQATVQTGHRAIFLADEKAFGDATFAPRLYQRKEYRELSKEFLAQHQPIWKMIIFNSGPFRVAFRSGPLLSQQKRKIYVECGLTVKLDQDNPLGLWNEILAGQDQLSSTELSRHLSGEVSGILQKWLAKQSDARLMAAFEHRDEVMLNLVEDLRRTKTLNGIQVLDPIYYLNFILPESHQAQPTQDQVYWQAPAPRLCQACQEVVPGDAECCDKCGAKLK